MKEKLVIGFCFTGSFCTLSNAVAAAEQLIHSGHTILPIISRSVAETDTRFYTAADFAAKLREITGKNAIDTIAAAEPLGPKIKCDAMIICPATGNTVSKIASNITDTPVTMAAKAHLRNNRPLIIAVSTNDGLAGCAESIGRLLVRKNIYFVPFGQDDPQKKPASLVADFTKTAVTLQTALEGKQLQPILL